MNALSQAKHRSTLVFGRRIRGDRKIIADHVVCVLAHGKKVTVAIRKLRKFQCFIDDGLHMFAKIQFLGQKGKTINEETYKSFLEWFMSSASSKKGKHDLQMDSLEPESVFLKEIGSQVKCKAWDPVGRVGKTIYRRRQVKSRIVNAALLSIIVNFSCRLLLCRFSAGELPSTPGFLSCWQGIRISRNDSRNANGEYNPKRTHSLQARIKSQTGFPGSAKNKIKT